ncbi:hypothetical protein [Paracoccus sp. (in: a-proteobacteria)]|uniref:hypothetical protein n=1 Tax=Paracoccus sp. TaxID=267 RepID=UPI003A8B5D02
MNLNTGDALDWWQVTALTGARFDVADAPMQGQMDSTFFLTKDRNWIPHTYPCRTDYIARVRGIRPPHPPPPDWAGARNVLPTGAPFLDLSGFWFRPTRVNGWARTVIHAKTAGRARLRLGICGAAMAHVNGQVAGWLSPATRNAMDWAEFDADLRAGPNEIAIWFEDLCERDAAIRLALIWLSGPEARAGHSFPGDASLTDRFRDTVAALHLDAKSYDNHEIALILPVPFPCDVSGVVRIAGHFMSHGHVELPFLIAKGQDRLRIAHSDDLPADYRYFDFAFTGGDLTVEARLGAEASWRDKIGPAPSALPDRIAETLTWIARHAEADTETALACAAIGDEAGLARAQAIILHALSGIEDCFDCADFALVPLLWIRMAHADRLPAPLVARIDAAILNFRYWMDEPGNDVQWYFSENHALLFHSSAYLAGHLLPDARFRRSGRTGRDQSRTGHDRLMGWFDHFEAAEMAEFNSATYFPIDLKGLLALFALAPDDDIRNRAGKAIARLITVIANSAHHGVITGAQGRSYEHSLCAADTQELTGMARLLWGTGSFGTHVNCLTQLALCLRDHRLDLPDLADIACWNDPATAQEWMFWQGQGGFARLYHYKTAETAMGSAALYRWGEWGYQETLIQARIGRDPLAQVFINHPGELIQSGFGRPSFWGGSASIPRVQQYRDLALVKFDGDPAQPDFTHAWFPTPVFDEWQVSGHRAAALSGNGALVLSASGGLGLIRQGGSADHEIRLAGRDGLWLLRLGHADDLPGFAARHRLDAVLDVDGTIRVDDADYGEVVFHPDGVVKAEGRCLDPRDWGLRGDRRVLNIVP